MPARRSRGAALRPPIVAVAVAALIILACSGGKRPAPAASPPRTAPAAVVQGPGAATTQQVGTASPAETPPPAEGNETPAPPRPPTPLPTPVPLDPCSLVTEGEAAGVLGRPAGPPHVQRTPLLAQCQYAPASATPAAGATLDATLPTVTIQVFPTDPLTWPVRKATFMKVNKTVIAVTGVGEDAFWVGDQEALFVLQHGVIFAIRVLGSEPEQDLADARTLALKAAARVG